MALTATPQSALPPLWDEQVVPALRKRLEAESRMLSKRMSAASMASTDENPGLTFSAESTMRDQMTSSSYSTRIQQPPGIPRPSLQQSRTADTRPNTGSSHVIANGISSPSSKPTTFTRPRTKSQPFSFDLPRLPNGNANGVSPTTDSSRPSTARSPDVKPTRIPMVSRGRTPSTSSHGRDTSVTGRSESRNGGYSSFSPPPESSADLWAVEEAEPSTNSRSNTSALTRQRSGILNEPPPFRPTSVASSATSQASYDHVHEAPPRPSVDSEERPFEHWYRGEVSRNGGVGELRVGKRMEMLQIANYGHSLKKAQARVASSRERPAVGSDSPRRRRRADSVAGTGARESFYLDDERAKEIAMVLDEDPLTDLDGEGDTDVENEYTHGYHEPESPEPDSASQNVTPKPAHRTPSRTQTAPPTRIPGPTPRQSSEPSRSPTPSQTQRAASEPPASTPMRTTPSSTPQSVPRSTPIPQGSQVATPKRRAKSPATPSSTSASKKAKTKPKQVSRRVLEDQENRRSVAEYPAPAVDGDDIMDAIPSWTQPVPAGNWDEVVLPVVARKKGLDEHYEKADGSSRPKKQDTRVEPAPGTFGYNPSRYRTPTREDIPMNEFGLRPPKIAEANEDRSPQATADRRISIQDHRPIRPQKPPSPLPFAHYGPGEDGDMLAASKEQQRIPDLERQDPPEDEGSAGCCKCVIM